MFSGAALPAAFRAAMPAAMGFATMGRMRRPTAVVTSSAVFSASASYGPAELMPSMFVMVNAAGFRS